MMKKYTEEKYIRRAADIQPIYRENQYIYAGIC